MTKIYFITWLHVYTRGNGLIASCLANSATVSIPFKAPHSAVSFTVVSPRAPVPTLKAFKASNTERGERERESALALCTKGG